MDDEDEVYSWCEALAGDCAWVVSHSDETIWIGQYGIHRDEYGDVWAQWDHGFNDSGGTWGACVLLRGDARLFFPVDAEEQADDLARAIKYTWYEL